MWFVVGEVVCALCSAKNCQQGQTVLPEEVNCGFVAQRERGLTHTCFVVNVHFGDQINFSCIF